MENRAVTIPPSVFAKYAASNPSVWQTIEGQRISHCEFGSGAVLQVITGNSLQDSRVWVRFDNQVESAVRGLTDTIQLSMIVFANGILTSLSVLPELADKIQTYQAPAKQQEGEQQRVRLELEADRKWAEKEPRKSEAERQIRLRATQETARIVAEEHQKAELQERAIQIQRFCRERSIKTLVHFTHIHNLRSILEKGLLGRTVLESWDSEQRPLFNDEVRLDGCKEAVCLSVSFPNYRMFFKYRSIYPGKWAVVLLLPDVLWVFLID